MPIVTALSCERAGLCGQQAVGLGLRQPVLNPAVLHGELVVLLGQLVLAPFLDGPKDACLPYLNAFASRVRSCVHTCMAAPPGEAAGSTGLKPLQMEVTPLREAGCREGLWTLEPAALDRVRELYREARAA